jgi:hypothetical protein
MKHPPNHTPQSSSPTHSKVTSGIDSKPSPLIHPWWIYRANQMKISHSHGAALLAHIDPFPDAPPSDSEDLR